MEIVQQTGIDERIVSFLKSQTAVSICTCLDNVPYSCICFYAYSTEFNTLAFKSGENTLHIRQALSNPLVSGSVLPDKLEKTRVRGLQLLGRFFKPEGEILSSLQRTYYKKYPIALTMKGDLWAIELSNIKLTDNTLGFGKKIIWKKEEN
ncbi:pyridoxamine 5'-phosphate oxidase family protein [Desertivirga brevis]|uniref:pyridoxamine 5'-phosphate oxidase family protein n=1 Tax=Desertivirga brevis TaxID=2810310 RepID=UPI001A95BDC3|nr:pyridoxamine 5'-phosphate oxidase family protein [Pedobacter sp. SYSU D00873]